MGVMPRNSKHTAFPVVWWFCWIFSGPPSLQILKILQCLYSWGQGHCHWAMLAKVVFLSGAPWASFLGVPTSDSAYYWNSCVNTTVTPWERDYSPVCFCNPQRTAHQQSMDGLTGIWRTALKSGGGLESGAKAGWISVSTPSSCLMTLDWFPCLSFLLRLL